MDIKPFALKLTRGTKSFVLKGKVRNKGNQGKFAIPILPEGLTKVVNSITLPKTLALQLNQELILDRSNLIPEFLTNLKNNITAKIRR